MITYDVKLTVLSPVHISSQGEKKPNEFIKDYDCVRIISENQLARVLSDEGLVNDFVAYVENNNSLNISDFLEQIPERKKIARIKEKITRRKIPCINNPTNLRVNISDPSGMPYIPGSSLKGALRTTMLYLMCEQNNGELKNIVSRIPDRPSSKSKKFASQLDRNLLMNIPFRKVSNSNKDWFRALLIDDLYPNIADCSQIEPVKVVSLDERGYHFGARNFAVNVEAIKAGTVLTGELRIDDDFLKIIKTYFKRDFIGFEYIFENVNERFSSILEKEYKFFKKAGLQSMERRQEELIESGANFRLGWGSGLFSTSIAILLNDTELLKLRDAFFQKRYYNSFPQSRKVIVEGNKIKDTLGWLKLELDKH